ncbi:MAG TPA: hypothetical protein VL360_03530 [Gammaproteobacteria bacterium]|jgi:hypothetical protein|nr:hypothetical protein [Gammaproteobacteria bacterium]
MFRKSLNLIFKGKRNNTRAILDAEKMKVEVSDDANSDEPETMRVFKRSFIKKIEIFKVEAEILAQGHVEFDEGWRETLLREGIGLSAAVIGCVIGLLGALMILSAAVSAGIAIPVVVIGIAAVIAFYKYRDHVKQKRFISASNEMDRDEISENIRDIADLLANLYQVQLTGCTVGDARLLADACCNAITLEMLKNKNFNFNELLDAASLQALLTRAETKIPKHQLSLKFNTTDKLNTRGLITHSAYYCRDTGEFYHSSNSKNKYGVLFFDTKADLKDYEVILNETMSRRKSVKLTKMNPLEVNTLMSSSMFRAYKNDRHFNQKTVLENDEINKLTLV